MRRRSRIGCRSRDRWRHDRRRCGGGLRRSSRRRRRHRLGWRPVDDRRNRIGRRPGRGVDRHFVLDVVERHDRQRIGFRCAGRQRRHRTVVVEHVGEFENVFAFRGRGRRRLARLDLLVGDDASDGSDDVVDRRLVAIATHTVFRPFRIVARQAAASGIAPRSQTASISTNAAKADPLEAIFLIVRFFIVILHR